MMRSRARAMTVSLLLLASSLLGTFFLSNDRMPKAEDATDLLWPTRYVDHSPISITGNSALLARAASEGWPGSGSENDPVRLSGFRIVANSQFGIHLVSIDLHVEVSNCNITKADVAAIDLNDVMNANISFNLVYSNQGDGIRLSASSNCRVTNNTLRGAEVINNYNGISIYSSTDVLVESNFIMLCVNDGIGLFDGSSNNVIRSNIVKENLNNGIELQGDQNIVEVNHLLYNRAGVKVDGDYNLVRGNRPTQNGYGVELTNASNNLVTNNVMVRNFQGISVIISYSNTMTGNYILMSFDYGININCNLKSNNILYDNVLYYNNETSSFYQKGLVQAKDVPGDSIWNSPQNRGNFWWDWRSPDNNEDLIIDFPYKLHGGTGKDPYPLLQAPIPDLFTPPGSLKATPGHDFINLTWTKPYYSLKIGVIHYNLYRSERGGGELLYMQLDGRSTNFVDTDVVRGRSYYYYITAWNGYAESNRSNRVKSSPDTKAPTVSVVGPEDGDYINTSWAYLQWTGTDNIKIDRYELSIDDGPFLDMGLNESFEVPYLKNGPHEFKVRIYDLAEHMDQEGAGFTVDTDRPELVIDGGVNGVTVFGTDRPLLFFRGWDGITDILDFMIKYHTYGWKSLGVTDSYKLEPVPDGYHNITMKVLDLARNWRTANINITVDTTEPKFQILAPLDGSFVPSTNVQLSWRASPDLTGPLQFEVRFDYEDWGPPIKDSSTVIQVQGEGEHGVEIMAIDGAKNTYFQSSSFIVDLRPPVVEIVTPGNNDLLNSPFYVEWSSLDDRSPIVSYRVILDGSTIAEVSEGVPVSVGKLDEGAHSITVEARDSAGNVGSSSSDFLYDPTPPTIVSVHPTGNKVDIEDFIRVSFSERMDTSSVGIDGLPSKTGFSWEGSMVLNVELFEPLSYSTTYVLSIHGTDIARNQLIRYEWSFRTIDDPRNPMGRIKGRTVDEVGAPLSNVSIRFRSGEKVQSGPDGTFEVEVATGNGLLTASKKDYLETSLTYNVTKGQLLDLGDIPLKLVPVEEGGDEGIDLTLPVLILTIALMAAAAAILVAYQVRKTKEYQKLPMNEKDEWVNVHDLKKK